LFTGVGAPGFGPVAANVPFRIGTFTYFNGTINFLTGAYGAPFTITPSDPTIDPLVSSYTNIDSKNYTDNRPVPFWAAPFVPAGWNNGDLISADGMVLSDFGKIALVKEGKNVTFDLMGKIVGDPMLVAVDITVDPISIDDGAVIPLADETTLEPEPSSWLLLTIGIVGLCGYGWRQEEVCDVNSLSWLDAWMHFWRTRAAFCVSPRSGGSIYAWGWKAANCRFAAAT
jgi:hypothetical protein